MKDTHHRFWSKVDMSGECWLWQAATDQRYGTFWDGEKRVKAHRYSWQITNGEIPLDLLVLHSCDTPLCVNPNHLRVGTHAENNRDTITRGRWNPSGVKGEKCHASKLTEQDVIAIYNDNRAPSIIAEKFGVSRQTIHQIRSGYTWKHVTATR